MREGIEREKKKKKKVQPPDFPHPLAQPPFPLPQSPYTHPSSPFFNSPSMVKNLRLCRRELTQHAGKPPLELQSHAQAAPESLKPTAESAWLGRRASGYKGPLEGWKRRRGRRRSKQSGAEPQDKRLLKPGAKHTT